MSVPEDGVPILHAVAFFLLPSFFLVSLSLYEVPYLLSLPSLSLFSLSVFFFSPLLSVNSVFHTPYLPRRGSLDSLDLPASFFARSLGSPAWLCQNYRHMVTGVNPRYSVICELAVGHKSRRLVLDLPSILAKSVGGKETGHRRGPSRKSRLYSHQQFTLSDIEFSPGLFKLIQPEFGTPRTGHIYLSTAHSTFR